MDFEIWCIQGYIQGYIPGHIREYPCGGVRADALPVRVLLRVDMRGVDAFHLGEGSARFGLRGYLGSGVADSHGHRRETRGIVLGQ